MPDFDLDAALNTREKIQSDTGEPEGSWTCVCGNIAEDCGFFPCDERGAQVEPDHWTTPTYVCDSCGRIIDVNTLEVVGVRYA